jgi:hypothetical protein
MQFRVKENRRTIGGNTFSAQSRYDAAARWATVGTPHESEAKAAASVRRLRAMHSIGGAQLTALREEHPEDKGGAWFAYVNQVQDSEGLGDIRFRWYNQYRLDTGDAPLPLYYTEEKFGGYALVGRVSLATGTIQEEKP